MDENESIALVQGDILDMEFINGKWRDRSAKECIRMLGAFDFIADDPIAASTANVDTVTGGLLSVDGVTLAAGDRVLLKDQNEPVENGYWIVQSGAWNRDPSYGAGNSTVFTNKYIAPKQGKQKGKVFYLVEEDYRIGTDTLTFHESAFSLGSTPGKIPLYDRSGGCLSENRHAGMVEGVGRDFRLVFGITSTNSAVYIPRIMAEITRRCNNNNEIDSSGIPDFIGIEIGDYIDGLDLSAIPAENGGDGGQAWNGTYKSIRSQRRIRSSGIMGVGISCVCRRVCHFLPSW